MSQKHYLTPPFSQAVKIAQMALGAAGGIMLRNPNYPNHVYPKKRSGSPLVRKRFVKSTKKSFKRKVENTKPAKHYTVGLGQATMLHNSWYTASPTYGVTQGDTNANRDGDSIYIEALKIKGFYSSDVADKCYSMRLIVGWSDVETGSATLTLAGLTSANIFLPGTDVNWAPNGIVNPKALTTLYDQTFDVQSSITGVADNQSFMETIQIQKPFVYKSSADTFGKNRNLVILVLAAINGGTSGTTDAGDVYMAYDLIFK